MGFGRVPTDELSGIDFTLPPDRRQTGKVLSGKKAKTKVYEGYAKWGRPEWVILIYPKGNKATDFLSHYAKHFNSIGLSAPSPRRGGLALSLLNEKFECVLLFNGECL